MLTVNKIVVIGLGYVGLPLALAFAGEFENVVGYDSDTSRISKLKQGLDLNGEIESSSLTSSRRLFSGTCQSRG